MPSGTSIAATIARHVPAFFIVYLSSLASTCRSAVLTCCCSSPEIYPHMSLAPSSYTHQISLPPQNKIPRKFLSSVNLSTYTSCVDECVFENDGRHLPRGFGRALVADSRYQTADELDLQEGLACMPKAKRDLPNLAS